MLPSVIILAVPPAFSLYAQNEIVKELFTGKYPGMVIELFVPLK